LQIFPKVLETEHSFFKSRILYKQKQGADATYSSINKVLESVEELPLATEKLSRGKYLRKVEESQRTGKRETFY